VSILAHGYPLLRKYTHLKGNIGKAWFDQAELFNHWNGAILVTTNCIVPLHEEAEYGDRIFGYKTVGVRDIKNIKNDDFTPLINTALASPDIEGFESKETLSTGHHYKTILTLAPQILEAVQEGKLKRFFVIAGCDSPTRGRDYFRNLAASIPKDCVIITSSCGKFRFNDIDFGTVPGTEIPRYLDLGQCNDSIGAVEIAKALSEATGLPINDLPISIVLMWMEQKAIIILLGLFSLGIRDIYIGPKAPQFVNQDILNFLVDKFNLQLIGDMEEDLSNMLSAA